VVTIISFAAVPLAIKIALGSSWFSLSAAVVAGSLLMVAGCLRFRGVLKLRGMVKTPRLPGRRAGGR
jgi:hypothetical protein